MSWVNHSMALRFSFLGLTPLNAVRGPLLSLQEAPGSPPVLEQSLSSLSDDRERCISHSLYGTIAGLDDVSAPRGTSLGRMADCPTPPLNQLPGDWLQGGWLDRRPGLGSESASSGQVLEIRRSARPSATRSPH
ncbi:unnamed protein product [Boreogadus saida]